MEKPRSTYRGSQETYRRVAAQIAERWGKEEVANYDPYSSAMTFRQWAKAGYKINKGEKALKSTTLVEKTDDNGNVLTRYPRVVNLFYIKQVSKLNEESLVVPK
jgi:hypothetical protein